jgi:succinate-semialdehyde dehydrogenase/glutarate-semialdehyde dehydrogenase
MTATKLLSGVPRELLIGGEWCPATGGATLPVEDPATGEIIAEVADASPVDAIAALEVASAAQAGWASTAPRERAELLRRAFDLLVDRRERFASLIALEMGKPLAEARGEVDYGAEFLRWFSEESVRVGGEYRRSPDGTTRILVSRQPVGPALLITPWNFPLAMASRKIAPAIAAGCTMVLKPAKQTPLTSLAFAALLLEAGLPAGVLGVVPTSKAGEVSRPMLDDQRLRKLSFTGSTDVGRHLVERSAGQLLRVSMELGGNAPFLVFGDADIEAAVDGAVLAKMRNMGEACTAANRFYVADPVADEFVERFGDRLESLKVGPGLEPDSEVGPMIDSLASENLSELVADAVDRGAELRVGGAPRSGSGHFFEPTLLDRVPADARMLDEEIFGPVAPVQRFDTEAEALTLANATPYGLVAYAYTRDLDRALWVADRLDVGMVGINRGVVSNAAAPFGGIKHSGMGREGGREGIDEYLDVKYIAVDA